MADTVFTQHAFRLQVCKPRSAAVGGDSDPLTPLAGAPHSDSFRVTTLYGDTWGQPYLAMVDPVPSRFEPIAHVYEKTSLSFRVLDKRCGSDPADNSERWATAFIGDADKKDQLAGCKVICYETTDNGGTWNVYFTGRIESDGYVDGSVVFRLDCKDLSDDLEFDIFVGKPHEDAVGVDTFAYSYPQPCAPVGLPFNYGGMKPVASFSGTAVNVTNGRGITQPDKRARRATVTEAFKALASGATITQDSLFSFSLSLQFTGDTTVVYVGAGSTAAGQGPYPLRRIDLYFPNDATDGKFRIARVVAEGFDTGLDDGPDGARPALSVGNPYNYRILDLSGASEAFPLLIGDVHPAQLFKDICLGYFGYRDEVTGDPLYAAAIDETAFDALIADTTFKKIRLPVDKVWIAADFIEDVICKTCGIGYRLERDGTIVPFDMRLRTPTSEFYIDQPLVKNVQDSVVTDHDAGDAITRVNGTIYVDQQLSLDTEKDLGPWPAIPNTMMKSTEVPIIFIDNTDKAQDIGDKDEELDALGFRLALGIDGIALETSNILLTQVGRKLAVENRLLAAIDVFRRPFLSGRTEHIVRVSRTTETDAIRVGMFGTVEVDKLPDKATNVRGGARYVLCVGVTPIDSIELELTLLDIQAGVSGGTDPLVADPPTLGAVSEVTGALYPSLQFDVTLNAAGDAAALEYIITATSVLVRPAEDDEGWTPMTVATADSTAVLTDMPSGVRVWFRGRSEPARFTTTGDVVLPSEWVFPAGDSYFDTDALPVPTGVTATEITESSAKISWTNTSTTYAIQLLWALGTKDATTIVTDGEPIYVTLPAGATYAELFGLSGPNVTQTVGVRYIDGAGGFGEPGVVTFTTAVDGTTTAPRMAGIGLQEDA